ncbi:MAG: ABC-F family ATP-binding cassette domain-containing protein, partial [Oceanihabitans sp.]
MITVDNLAVEFSGTTLFSDVNFVINPNDKIALMGKNGAGKSTMMKIVAGVQNATRGKISHPKDTVIAYLPQHLLTEDNCTVFEEASKAFAHIFKMKSEMDTLNKALETRTDYESDEYMSIIEKVSELGEQYYALEDVNYDAEVEKALKGLGFKQEDFTRLTNEFSGGWRMRIELAKILLQKPDLILLDEPTNHIDIESVIWLEDFLVNKANAVMVISHDRAFIDNITNRTIEVTMGRIYDYKANYSHYLQLREDRRSHQIKAYQEQQKFIADNMAFIERFKGTYSKTNQVSSRERMLEKLQIIEIDEVDNSALKLKFPPAQRSGDYPVIVEGLSKSYGDVSVFKDASFSIARGEKVCFVGRNGEGKSTMIKSILGEIEVEGKCSLGHNVQVG